MTNYLWITLLFDQNKQLNVVFLNICFFFCYKLTEMCLLTAIGTQL